MEWNEDFEKQMNKSANGISALNNWQQNPIKIWFCNIIFKDTFNLLINHQEDTREFLERAFEGIKIKQLSLNCLTFIVILYTYLTVSVENSSSRNHFTYMKILGKDEMVFD